jgi:hypothetical protein
VWTITTDPQAGNDGMVQRRRRRKREERGEGEQAGRKGQDLLVKGAAGLSDGQRIIDAGRLVSVRKEP